jgi:hypothetical protein
VHAKSMSVKSATDTYLHTIDIILIPSSHAWMVVHRSHLKSQDSIKNQSAGALVRPKHFKIHGYENWQEACSLGVATSNISLWILGHHDQRRRRSYSAGSASMLLEKVLDRTRQKLNGESRIRSGPIVVSQLIQHWPGHWHAVAASTSAWAFNYKISNNACYVLLIAIVYRRWQRQKRMDNFNK